METQWQRPVAKVLSRPDLVLEILRQLPTARLQLLLAGLVQVPVCFHLFPRGVQLRLEGLYHAGAGVMGPGVVPCLASGIVAAKIAAAEHREKRVGFFSRPRLSAS